MRSELYLISRCLSRNLVTNLGFYQQYGNSTLTALVSLSRSVPPVFQINVLCIHSKVSAHIIRDFENPSSLDEKKNKKDKSTRTQHLAVVFLEDKTSLLYTTGKQCLPTCSNCFSRKYRWQKKSRENETEQTTPTVETEPTVQTEDDDERSNSSSAHYLLKGNSHFPNKTLTL